MGRLIIDGNSVYEIDESCEMRKIKEEAGSCKDDELSRTKTGSEGDLSRRHK